MKSAFRVTTDWRGRKETMDNYKRKEKELLHELRKARVTAVAHLEEIDRKLVALTGDSMGKSGGRAGYKMTPLGKQVIILAANVRGLKHRVANGQARKAELVAAQRDLKALKAKASVEKKIARNKRIRELRAAKRKTSY